MTQSIGELLNDYSSTRKQHFWDFFSRGSLIGDETAWEFEGISGTNSCVIGDIIDGGCQLRTDGSTGNQACISWEDIRQYDATASVCIGVTQSANVTETANFMGLIDDWDWSWDVSPAIDFAGVKNHVGNDYYRLHSNDGSGSGSYDTTSVAKDTNWHCHKIELTSTTIKLWIDGVLRSSKTSDRPSGSLQPRFDINQDAGSGVKVSSIRYLEAYNT